MNYPMKEVRDPWSGGTIYREMTPAEYTEKLEWFRNYLKTEVSCSRREEEYLAYLARWFSDSPCDGFPNVEKRLYYHQLPMSYNIYMNH